MCLLLDGRYNKIIQKKVNGKMHFFTSCRLLGFGPSDTSGAHIVVNPHDRSTVTRFLPNLCASEHKVIADALLKLVQKLVDLFRGYPSLCTYKCKIGEKDIVFEKLIALTFTSFSDLILVNQVLINHMIVHLVL